MFSTAYSRRDKWVLALGAFVFLLLCGGGWLLAKAKSAPAIPPRAALPKPNGFDLYVAAAWALTVFNPPVDAVNDNVRRTPPEIAENYTPARRAAYVSANAKSWKLMAQARAAQTLHPDMRGDLVTNLP